jgi:hypothetical protein
MCRSASTTVLPVTTTPSVTPSRRRFSAAVSVGAKCQRATMLVARRFISSGNGSSRLPERRPASTWASGTRWWKAASAPPRVLVVSPCTTIAAGRASDTMAPTPETTPART